MDAQLLPCQTVSISVYLSHDEAVATILALFYQYEEGTALIGTYSTGDCQQHSGGNQIPNGIEVIEENKHVL